jgi:hypothetical protein
VEGRVTAPAVPNSDERVGAERVAAVIDLLLVVSYIDGEVRPEEHAFVDQYLESVVRMIEMSAHGTASERAGVKSAWATHFSGLREHLLQEIATIAPPGREAVAPLRARALSRFRGLAVHDQATALELVTSLLHADGTVNALEHGLHKELMDAFVTPAPAPAVPVAPTGRTAPMIIAPAVWNELTAMSHPLLDPVEQTFSPHPIERQAQIEWDAKLLQNAIRQWQRLRTVGTGRLNGITDVAQLPPGSAFLDDYVHVIRPDRPVELIVLGDLHGCYSCLKAALLQSNFIERVWAHQWDPVTYPEVKLVFLGDYIDRGRFSFDGVLRAALHLFASMPDHVILLRGNHEWFRWFGQTIGSGVYPAEGIASIAPYVPIEMLEAYRVLFEHMPTSLIVDRTMYVHAGIPRDDTFAAKWRDLSSLNDAEIRFQMMWSDPVQTDHVPVETQRLNPRFNFGRRQFFEFMQRTGMQTMIRGHEQIERGFEVFYDLGDQMLIDLFSAGGFDNSDLPVDSSYRTVTPMALTVIHGQGTPVATPWPLHYRPFNYAPHNGLYRVQPNLEYRYL